MEIYNQGKFRKAVEYNVGTCLKKVPNQQMSYRSKKGTGMYDFDRIWCEPRGNATRKPPKLVKPPCTCLAAGALTPCPQECSRRQRIQGRIAIGSSLYLAECSVDKRLHLYQCKKKDASCRNDKQTKCAREDMNGNDCNSAAFRGETTKLVQCVGFYEERKYQGKHGHRGELH